jgi:hypothetical protein
MGGLSSTSPSPNPLAPPAPLAALQGQQNKENGGGKAKSSGSGGAVTLFGSCCGQNNCCKKVSIYIEITCDLKQHVRVRQGIPIIKDSDITYLS